MRANTFNSQMYLPQKVSKTKISAISTHQKNKISINSTKLKALKIKKAALYDSQLKNTFGSNKLPLITESKSPSKVKGKYTFGEGRSKTPLGIRRNMNLNDFSMNINNNYINNINLGTGLFSKNELQIILSLKKELKAKNEENARLKNDIESIHRTRNNTTVKELEIENKVLNDEIGKMKRMCSEMESSSKGVSNKDDVKSGLMEGNKEENDKMKEMQKTIDSLNLQNKKLKEVVSMLNTNMTKAQKEINEKDEEIEKYKKIIEQLQNNKEVKHETIVEKTTIEEKEKISEVKEEKKDEEIKTEEKTVEKEITKEEEIKEVSEENKEKEITTEEEVLEKQIRKTNESKNHFQSERPSYHHIFKLSSIVSFSYEPSTPLLPNMISPDEMEKVIFLLIKTIQSKNVLPLDVITPLLQKIHTISDFTHEMTSLYHFDSESQFTLNRFAFGMGYKNEKFSIEYFKTMLTEFFSNPNVNILLNDFDIVTEFKSNCLSDIISKCGKYDIKENGFITFELFTSVIVPYVNSNEVSKQGYEYLIYTMKKVNSDSNNELYNNIFMLNYSNLSVLIPKFSSTITKEDESKQEHLPAEELPDLNFETKNYTNELFANVLKEREIDYSVNKDMIVSETKSFIEEVFEGVLKKRKENEGLI